MFQLKRLLALCLILSMLVGIPAALAEEEVPDLLMEHDDVQEPEISSLELLEESDDAGAPEVSGADLLIPDDVDVEELVAKDAGPTMDDGKGFVITGGVLTAYTGTDMDIVIPSTVTAIGEGAFESGAISSVVIPGSVKAVGKRAFASNPSLWKVTFQPGNGCTIGEEAFFDCHSLKELALPEGLTSIGRQAFYCCGMLPSVTIPDSVTSVGADAFGECWSLESFTILGKDACDLEFALGRGSFGQVERVNTPDAPEFYVVSGTLLKYNGSGAVTVPKKVGGVDIKKIGAFAFQYCSGITSVTIPSGVTSIGDSAFEYCTRMTSVTMSDTVTSLGHEAFGFCRKLKNVRLSTKLKKLRDDTFTDCTALASIAIPASVTSIGRYCFAGCTGLTTVTLSEGLKTLGDHAFFMDEKLGTVILPTTLTTIPQDVFMECFNVTVRVYEGSYAHYLSKLTFDGVNYYYDVKKIKTLPAASNRYYLSDATHGVTLNVAVGDTLQITTPGDTAKSYKSSKATVAKVSTKGLITIKKKGNATITVTMIDGVKHTLKLKAVKSAKPKTLSIAQGSKYTLPVGGKLQLSLKVTPTNGRSAYTWSSSKKSVAKVSSSGMVTALKKGTAKITVKARKGGKNATITITVK